MLYTMNEIDPKPVDGFSTAKLSLYGLMNVPMVQAENRKHADALFLALPLVPSLLVLSLLVTFHRLLGVMLCVKRSAKQAPKKPSASPLAITPHLPQTSN